MVSPQHSKILIVEDDPDMLDLIAEHFQVFGFKILKAQSGNHAISQLKEQSVNIIISDIQMEDGDGVELLKYVKSQDVFKPNFYFISGYSNYKLKDVLNMGADGLFFKPFDAATLRSSIKKSLLPRQNHWSTKPCEGESLENLELDSRSPHWGRGGFSVDCDKTLNVGEFVSFKSENNNISGIGRVVWVEDHRLGVEIEFLPIKDIQQYEEYLEFNQPLSYIPL